MLVAVGTDAPLLGESLPIELMNTIWADRDGVHDALCSPPIAGQWVDAIAPRSGIELSHDRSMDDAAVHQLVALRDALRTLAAEATGDPRPPASTRLLWDRAVDSINAAVVGAHLWPVLTWGADGVATQTTHTLATPIRALTSLIAQQAIVFFAGDERSRLRACLAPGCVLYFTKNHPRREWCSAACGNRARVARHYQRHHQGEATEA